MTTTQNQLFNLVKKPLTVLALSTLMVSTTFAKASEINHQLTQHLSISTVEVTDVTEKYEKLQNSKTSLAQAQAQIQEPVVKPTSMLGSENKDGLTSQSWLGALTEAEVVVDQVINIGTKIWNVVVKGKPVTSYKQAKANALPQNLQSWQQLEGWSQPQAKYYQIIYKNLYGIEVVKLVYKIIYLTGGSFNGQGKYIGYVSVEPREMKTAYMYTFNVQAQVESVFNKGTKESPVAAMIININWTVETVLKTETQSHSYTIDGLGRFSQL